MKRIAQIVICIFLSLWIQTALSQENYTSKLHFESYTIAEGISQNNITCLFQDSRGFLWIGTQAGLNCYDGNTFEVFKNDPEEVGTISDNMIFGICEDKNNNIWIATENGLNMFNRDSHSFTSHFVNTENPSKSISDNIIYAVFCDNEGSLWLKTPMGIDRINLNTNIFSKYEYEKDIFAKEVNNFNHTIYQDHVGVIWIGTKEGLGYYEPEVDDIILFKHNDLNKNTISNNEVRCIYEDNNNNLWIGTSNGLNMFVRKNKTFLRYYYSSEAKNQNCITGISPGKTPFDLWITTNNHGLFNYSTKKLEFSQFTHSTINNSIISNETNCIIKDRSNILWIGTRIGLNKLDIKPKKFQVLTLDNSSTFNAQTTSIYTSDTHIYIGTLTEGLWIYNKKLKTTTNYSKTKGNYKENSITSISPSNTGEVYIAGDQSIMVFNPKNETFVVLHKKVPEFEQFQSNSKLIKAVYEDIYTNIWVGTNNGIFVFNAKNRRIYNFDKYSNTRSLPSNNINSFYQDSDENLWIATDKGLVLFDYESSTFSQFNYAKKTTPNKIYCITEDANSLIWLGTNSGLYSFNLRDSIYEYYTEKDGLPNNQIFGLLVYKNDIWISTNKGLAEYNTEKKIFKVFDPSDGIQGYEFSPNCASKTKNNFMFFGGSEGINIFHPDSINDNPITPNLELNKLTYFSNNKKKTIYISEEKTVTLPYRNNTLTVFFSAIEFSQPKKNQYKYILEGMDKEWHDIANQNSINFSNLPSGTYQLKIIGSNNDRMWGHERILEIIVTTPIWLTIWAYFAYVIFFAAALYIFIESRTKALKKANKTLTEKQEAALEIAKQKEELTVKNKSITDSITYAKRIQWAIMPSRAKFKQLLPNSFILYMPKDIVSGDFYWITEIEDRIFVAAVDCTGHGVPGAFMSIIGYDLLRNITKERKIFKPSEILDYLNKALIELLTKNEMEDDAVKDGMDMSIVVIHKSKGILEFAGAFNPLYIIRNNKIISIKGDRFSVGLGNEHEDVPFKNHIVKIQPGDMFYLFSDGYADQFGGPKSKKMKYLRFRQLILSINNLPYLKQTRALKQYFIEWKGELEQIDDILVLGFNVDNYLEKLQRKK